MVEEYGYGESKEVEVSDYSDLDENERKEAEDFEKCLLKSINAHVGVFVKEYAYKDGQIVAERDVKDKVIPKDNVKPILRFSPEYIYLDLNFEFENDPALLAVNYMLEQWLNRNTEAFNLSGDNDRLVNAVVALNAYEKDSKGQNVTYTIELVNPAFFVKNGATERLSFPMNNLAFGIDHTDLSDVIEQIEYDNMMDELAGEQPGGVFDDF